MKQRRQRIGNPSIWHHYPKGLRAGNSPIWKPKKVKDEEPDYELEEARHREQDEDVHQEFAEEWPKY